MNFQYYRFTSYKMVERVVALVDMDCFYVQVEQRAQPEHWGKPCAVVQYKKWKGGGIIAVGYEARSRGVNRHMMGDEAKSVCPEIHLFRVPEQRGKADLSRYREASGEVFNVLTQCSNFVERASIDEAYIDLTEEVNKRIAKLAEEGLSSKELQNTFIAGFEIENKDQLSDQQREDARESGVKSWLNQIFDPEEGDLNEAGKRLAVGAQLAAEMRQAVFKETGFRCSAGIAHNKVLAKLCAGLNKPNGQTVLPQSAVNELFKKLPIKKVRGLGGKLGAFVMEELQAENMFDLQAFSKSQLQDKLGPKDGQWLYELCRGFEHEPVCSRQLPKSIGCSKNFRGKDMLDSTEKVKFWLKSLCEEAAERLNVDKEKNKRIAKTMTLSVRQLYKKGETNACTRSCSISSYVAEKLIDEAYTTLVKLNTAADIDQQWFPPLINLGISMGKFVDLEASSSSSILSFLSAGSEATTREFISNNTEKLSQAQPSKSHRGSIESFFYKKLNKPEESASSATNDINNLEKQMILPIEKDNDRKGFFANHKNVAQGKHSLELSPCTSYHPSSKDQLQIVDEDKYTPTIVSSTLPQEMSITSKTTLHPLSDPDPEHYMNCDQCGQKIHLQDFPEHADFHLAQSLQSAERTHCFKRRLSETSKGKAKRKKTIDSFFKSNI